MNNISLNGESVKTELNKQYLIIDTLYLVEIKKEMPVIIEETFFREIRERVFPYNINPFCIYRTKSFDFNISWIKKTYYEEDHSNVKDVVFSTDTGLIMLINLDILFDFIKKTPLTFNELVNSDTETISMKYWTFLASKYKYTDLGLILAPGVNSGFDFEGSGIYKIIDN